MIFPEGGSKHKTEAERRARGNAVECELQCVPGALLGY